MEDNSTTHALTEVALALAMAFFSIMVLAMVSMSVPRTKEVVTALPKDKVKLQQNEADEHNNAQSAASSESQFVFYFKQRFFDQKLQVIDLTSLSAGEVVLALPANLTVAEALQVKGQINRSNLVITQYNEKWQQRLESLQ